MITTSRAAMLAATTPFRPMVTRLSGILMLPSMRPSIYRDSEPLTSPFMVSERPIMACSIGAPTVLPGARLFWVEENWVDDFGESDGCNMDSDLPLVGWERNQCAAACVGSMAIGHCEYLTGGRTVGRYGRPCTV